MQSEDNPLNIFPHPDYSERAERFYRSYDLIRLTGVGDEVYSKRALHGYTTRSCLFCGRRYPEATFKTFAHIVPQLIGNSNLYSDFECDDCNKLFSELEGDLAAFLGVSRSIVGLGNEKKTVGFKGRRLTAKSRGFMDENILIIAPKEIETVSGTSTLKYTKNPFSPIAVYKAMLKASISLLGPEYATNFYKTALDILNGRARLLSGLVMSGYQLSFTTNLPFHVFQFRKKNAEDKIPTDILLFHFQNHMIAFPMPLHTGDAKLIDADFGIIVPPPYFTNEDNMRIAMPQGYVRDFSSYDVLQDEEESLIFKLDDSFVQKTVAYDPVTGKFEQRIFGENKTKYIILVKEGMQINPKELSEFIKKEMEP